MKKLISAIILSLAGCAPAWALFPQLVAESTGTTTTVAVTTTAAPIISTGTLVVEGDEQPFVIHKGTYAPTVSQGQVMSQRKFFEIFNDSGDDIFIGYNANVSSQANVNRGRRIPDGGAWAHDCQIRNHWAISGSSAGYLVTVTQER